MHRLKRWINEEVSFYKEQLKESPLETIAIYLSWVFVIIIGLMAVFAYIKFIIDYIGNNYLYTDTGFNHFNVCGKSNMEMDIVYYRYNCNGILCCENINESQLFIK